MTTRARRAAWTLVTLSLLASAVTNVRGEDPPKSDAARLAEDLGVELPLAQKIEPILAARDKRFLALSEEHAKILQALQRHALARKDDPAVGGDAEKLAANETALAALQSETVKKLAGVLSGAPLARALLLVDRASRASEATLTATLPHYELTMAADHTISRTGPVGDGCPKSLTWVVKRDGHVVLQRVAVSDESYRHVGIEKGTYTVHLTRVAQGSARIVSNEISYTIE